MTRYQVGLFFGDRLVSKWYPLSVRPDGINEASPSMIPTENADRIRVVDDDGRLIYETPFMGGGVISPGWTGQLVPTDLGIFEAT